MPRSSNATFLVELSLDGTTAPAVYKPERGERPLWDFPPGLFRREIAAYVLSETLGWGLVPPTIVREGPYGEGSLQTFVAADFGQHYFTLLEQPDHREALQRICLFDLVANNADRKSGHCLWVPGDRIYAIDHGLTFHAEPKLRTVIWEFAGDDVPAELRDGLRAMAGELRAGAAREALLPLLSPGEVDAMARRASHLARAGRYPLPGSRRPYPWPPV